MYSNSKERLLPILICIMISIVVLLMASYAYYQVRNAKRKKAETKTIVYKVEDWEENTKTFSLDTDKIEFTINATGSETDVKYTIKLSNLTDNNYELYSDENHLYEIPNDIEGTIDYKETMKKTFIIYINKLNVDTEPIEIPTVTVSVDVTQK